ncbi:hypothetical protein FEM03_14010 [Phragmitibacter flavus]|uniref:PilN domain-containing protein n=1 Tax=Phragmitibacter flavus TaxID=2576071 RepID=A0A5R8KEB1_9BACT|nr:hypothetical protein [Phragmitibacter flavus]TLD70295.1 hypothetical protein FEM03_14010 [Phragmitibacter flavus]
MSSATSFLMPDAAPTWQLWKSLHGSNPTPPHTPSECRQNGKPLVVGLPATACRTVGLILPDAPPDLIPSMVEAQLEKRGISITKLPQPNFAWHQLGHQPGQTLISVDVLPAPFPAELVVSHASNYTAALRMMQLPADELIIVQEQDQIVLALGHLGKLWHSHIIGTTATPTEDLAREIAIAQLALETTAATPLNGILLIGSHLAQLQRTLQPLLALPLKTGTQLEPNRSFKTDPAQRLLPAAVHQSQHRGVRRRQIILALLTLAVLYAALFFLAWLNLTSLEDRKAALQAEINTTGPPAAAVRTTAQRWRSLEAAIDIQRYPIVQLTHITALLPPSGIQIKKYIAKPAEIDIEGDARDAQSATQLLEDLKKHAQLSRFTWSMPVPAVRNNIATFKIQGKLQ